MGSEPTTDDMPAASWPTAGQEAKDRDLQWVNRALATLTRATEALIRTTDEQQLLNEICRILVDVGGYSLAWVGYIQHDDECSIWPVARFGCDNGFLAEARMTWNKVNRTAGPVNRAVQSNQPQITYVHSPEYAPWREAALRRGFFSTVTLPLDVEGSVIGILNLYSSETSLVDPDELLLMEKLARNLAWGIGMQRMQFERRRAAQELKESEGRYRSLVELSPDAIVAHTQGIIITERKQVEAQLVQTAKLATLGEMAAGMAHELSQPINIIRMAAEGALLMIDRRKATQDYQEKQFALVAAQAGRMAEIIDHIRIFSRQDTGSVAVFDARNSVRMAVQLMELQLKGDNIIIALRLPDHPCPVVGRPVQLEQVVINLLTNAHDAIKAARKTADVAQQGRICVEAALSATGDLKIMVADNGTGIGQTHLDRVFEPFFTTKEVGSGTGLGLSVSFGIITSMDGQLEAENIHPHGAAFTITLPSATEPAHVTTEANPAPKVDPPLQPTSHHILLVDDEQQAIDAMSAYLGEFGYRISHATCGRSAFQSFERDPADIVVTDIRMPDGDGEELVRRLRQLRPTLPIVVVTGHIGTTKNLEAAATNNLMILKKPISLSIMAKTIERLLRRV